MKNLYFVAIALVALAMPVLTLNAQPGRGAGAVPANNPAPTSPVTGNAASGKTLYYSYGCYACHGYNGETGARAFVGRWGHLETEQSFITFLRGRANVAPLVPSTSMPNFGISSLPDKQAKDIYAYIRTFKSSAPDLKDIPTLNAIVDAAKQEK
ncbi:MAG: cytochrome c [Bryobacteraceae bacterium]|jgi:mono/diheme cytochrome c family protein